MRSKRLTEDCLLLKEFCRSIERATDSNDILLAVEKYLDELTLVPEEGKKAVLPTSSYRAELQDLDEDGEFADECAYCTVF